MIGNDFPEVEETEGQRVTKDNHFFNLIKSRISKNA